MGTLLHDFQLSAKLPLLGPLIGATVPGDAGLVACLWIHVDNTQDEPPLFALTALWDGKRVCPGSARAWELTVVEPRDAQPPPALHFAVAMVEFPRAAEHCVIRMISLHRRAGTAQLPQYNPVTCGIDDAAVAGEALPEPTKFSPQGTFTGIERIYDELAEEAYAEIQARLKKIERELRKPIRKTRSRWALDLRNIGECEADLANGARDQLEKKNGALRFAATCCRHPGMGWDSERAERTFALLGDESRNPAGPAFALLTGDQIYADATAGAFDVADRFEKFSVRYEEAFGAPRFRRCAAGLPLYMAADDHEIEDGWSLTRLKEAQVPRHQLMRRAKLAAWARMMFISYQRLHGPRSPVLSRGWYEFGAAGIPFFVMDTRFERHAWGGGGAPRICGPQQESALRGWLDRQRQRDQTGHPLAGVPKFIVSGSVFAPGLEEFVHDPGAARRADTWQAFPGARAALAMEIAQRRLRNVVFLSGDYHCGAVAAIELAAPAAGGGGPLAAYAIVSPPAYAPFPFANVRAGEVAREERLADPQDAGGPPCARVLAEATEGEGYAEIRVARDAGDWSVEVRFVGLGFVDPDTGQPFARRLAGGRIHLLKQPG